MIIMVESFVAQIEMVSQNVHAAEMIINWDFIKSIDFENKV